MHCSLITLRVLRHEVDLDAVDHRIGTHCYSRLHVVLAITLAFYGGAERAETVELHGLTLREQLAHALYDLSEHKYTHLIVGDLAVTRHVLGETLEVQGLLSSALQR